MPPTSKGSRDRNISSALHGYHTWKCCSTFFQCPIDGDFVSSPPEALTKDLKSLNLCHSEVPEPIPNSTELLSPSWLQQLKWLDSSLKCSTDPVISDYWKLLSNFISLMLQMNVWSRNRTCQCHAPFQTRAAIQPLEFWHCDCGRITWYFRPRLNFIAAEKF